MASPPTDDQQLFGENATFTLTTEMQLENVEMCEHKVAITRMTPKSPVFALNSNWGHRCVEGWEAYLKPPKTKTETSKRCRKAQGDASCFNSAIEATIIPYACADLGGADPLVEHRKRALPAGNEEVMRSILEKKRDKVYVIKYFPTTGTLQIPGVIDSSLRDAAYILTTWVAFLEENGFRAAVGGAPPIRMKYSKTIVQNSKFALKPKHQLDSKGQKVILNLPKLHRKLLELKAAQDGTGPAIKEILYTEGDMKISFKFAKNSTNKKGVPKKIRVNIWCSGKVNLLNAIGAESALIHQYICDHFGRGRDYVVSVPLPDLGDG